MFNMELLKEKIKNKYFIAASLIIIILAITFLFGVFANDSSALSNGIAEYEAVEPYSQNVEAADEQIFVALSEESDEEIPQDSDSLEREKAFLVTSFGDSSSADSLDLMTSEAEFVLIGSFTEFVTSFNMARNTLDITQPAVRPHHEGRAYLFKVDEVLKGGELRGEMSPNVVTVVIPYFRLYEGQISNAVRDEDWNLIEEPTEFDPFAIEAIRGEYIEPIIGETVMLFLRYTETSYFSEGIGNTYSVWGEPWIVAFDSDGVAELRSNFMVPPDERPSQFFRSEGGRLIEYQWGRLSVTQDTISNLPLEEIVTTISEITGTTPPSTSMTVTTNNAAVDGVSATLTASLANNNGRVGFGFYWGTTSTPNNRVNVGVTNSSSQSFTFNLASLSPNTTYYFRAFAGASRGEVISFTTQEMLPGQSIFSVTPDDFINIFETDRNTREWQVTFWVTETFGDGNQNRFMTDFIIPGPNANLRGSYAFGADHVLAGHIIVFDIRNNGSNIVTFMLFHNDDLAGVELRAAYLTIESTDYYYE